jgi:hypothetical protein
MHDSTDSQASLTPTKTSNMRRTNMYTTILHEICSRVEIESFKVNGDQTQHVIWGEQGGKELDIHPDILMDHVLLNKHSFIFPRADQIRLIRIWNTDGLFVSGYTEFLRTIGIDLHASFSGDSSPENPYLQQLRSNSDQPEPWTRTALLKMWKELRGVSIGAGANKEIIEANTFGTLHPDYSIDLEALIDATSKEITKAAKYLGRLLRPFRYYSMETPSIKRQNMEVDAFIDGWTCSVDLNYCRGVLGAPKVEVGDRLEITALTGRGLLKGHGVVGDHDHTNVVLFGDQYKSIVKGSTLSWFAVEPLHGSEEAFLDIQTLVNLGNHVFPEQDLQGWISDAIATAVIKTRDTNLPALLKDTSVLIKDPTKISSDKWSLRRMAINELMAILPIMVRKTYGFHRSGIRRLNNLRVRIPGAIRRYVTPDLSGVVSVGSIAIKGQSFYISKDDANWFHRLHGGSDSDDSFVLIPITENRVLLYRNPNQLGEWSTMSIQESDHKFVEVNQMQTPLSQRYNIKSDSDSPDKIMETVSAFWDYMVASNVEVDNVLLPRIPESHRDLVKSKPSWLSKLYQYADDNLMLADQAIDQYTKEMPIPEELITAPRSQFYEVAKDLRRSYGQGIRKVRSQNEEIRKGDQLSPIDLDRDLQRRIDKVHAQTRGSINRYDRDAQKLIVRDLMRICYLELAGSLTGQSGYELTQANDGVLGIPSSPNGRSRGTWDIMIDFLVEQGFGTELVFEDNTIKFLTYDHPRNYSPEGMVIRVIGGWQNESHDHQESEDDLIARAYTKTKNAERIEIRSRNLLILGKQFGRIVSKASVVDGFYNVINPGRPGKSQILHIAHA